MAADQTSADHDVCRVVIADDSADIRMLVRTLLELDGAVRVVGEADNGRAAATRCEQTRPDVLVLDVSMPVMDGIEAIPHVRAASPDTRIVMLSGFATDEMKRLALDAGAVRFIEKGATIDEISCGVRDAWLHATPTS